MPTSTRKRVIQRKRTVDGPELQAGVAEYLQNRSMRERSEYHEGRIKKDLLSLLEEAGDQEEANKQTLLLDAPLDYTQYKGGKPVKKKIIGIERRIRVSNQMDTEKAMTLLAEKGLTEACTEVVLTINEDAILAANYAGKISDEEFASLMTTHTTPAFYLTEGAS